MNKENKIKNRSILQALRKYQTPKNIKSSWQLINSIIPYIILWVLAVYLYQYSVWYAIPVAIINVGFMVRIFIIFHDCGHLSFFKSRKVNRFWGVLTGLLTFTPFNHWTQAHARHHATSGNLDKRGEGDIWMMTVDEYMSSSKTIRFLYKLYRHPFVMFVLGPMFMILISNRIPHKGANRKESNSIHLTNLGLFIFIGSLCYLIGWKAYLVIQGITLFFAFVAGVWLFYVQHQFEGVYWSREKEWDFVEASLQGGSFYDLPRVLHWFTGNIGYHHIHHLNSRIPNYNLHKCQSNIPELNEVNAVRFFPSFKSLLFRLYDEKTGHLIGFRRAKKLYKKRLGLNSQKAA